MGLIRKLMRLILGNLKDRPYIANIIIVLFVVAHAFFTWQGKIPDFWQKMVDDPNAGNLYVAMLSVAALQASFAGVVVIFGLSTQLEAFRALRVNAGEELVSNWMSISYCGFVSAAFALVASLINILGCQKLAPWLFEFSVLFCAHGIIRLLWLLKSLIGIVKDDDDHFAQKKAERN